MWFYYIITGRQETGCGFITLLQEDRKQDVILTLDDRKTGCLEPGVILSH